MEVGKTAPQIGVALVLRYRTSLLAGVEADHDRGADSEQTDEQ
jgi:hypothetical protein